MIQTGCQQYKREAERPALCGAGVKIFPAALLLWGSVGIALLALTGSLPLSWDEPDTFDRAESAARWGADAFTGKLDKPFAAETLQSAFPNTIRREGHPAGYVMVVALGKKCGDFFPFLSEKVRYRFGPILLFSAAIGAVFYRVSVIFSPLAGLFAAGSILLFPRVFVHGQFAFCDSILMASWLLSWAFFFPALEKKRYAALDGVFIGLTCAAKFPGLLVVVPLAIGWGAACFFTAERTIALKKATGKIFLLALFAAITFFLLNPPLWHNPIQGFSRFFYLNTHRGDYNIVIQFLGEKYNLDRSLPWWNTLFWIAVTTPPGLMFAALLGLFFRKKTAFQRLAVITLALNFAILPFVRAFPQLPVHDGVRLFIAAFPFLGILAGIGLFNAATSCFPLPPPFAFGKRGCFWPLDGKTQTESVCLLWKTRKITARALVGVILLSAGYASCVFFPNGLSYYNGWIGGLAGAQKAGMETTYYWDSLHAEALDWLNAQTDADGSRTGKSEAILFGPVSSAMLRRYQAWGELTPEFMTVGQLAAWTKEGGPAELPRFRWYVFQRREGALSPADRLLLETKKPRFCVKRQGVSLLFVYSYRDFLEAVADAQQTDSY